MIKNFFKIGVSRPMFGISKETPPPPLPNVIMGGHNLNIFVYLTDEGIDTFHIKCYTIYVEISKYFTPSPL